MDLKEVYVCIDSFFLYSFFFFSNFLLFKVTIMSLYIQE